jgi:hypothetical protein
MLGITGCSQKKRRKQRTASLATVWLYEPLSVQAASGSRSSDGTLLTCSGMLSPNTGVLRNLACASEPSWIASTIARVYLSGQRLPVP